MRAAAVPAADKGRAGGSDAAQRFRRIAKTGDARGISGGASDHEIIEHHMAPRPAKTIRDLVSYKLSLVGLSGYEDYYPSQISGGMNKREWAMVLVLIALAGLCGCAGLPTWAHRSVLWIDQVSGGEPSAATGAATNCARR
jgi:hypothetical protein